MGAEEFTKFDILAWWKGKESQFPDLATMTQDLLSAQASTVASESDFSISGRVKTGFAISLSDEEIVLYSEARSSEAEEEDHNLKEVLNWLVICTLKFFIETLAVQAVKARCTNEEMKVEVKVIGNVVRVRVSGEGGGFEKKHYLGFESDGLSYQIEDTVLVTPPDENNLEMKPSVAIIKDVYETPDGSINVTGQKFYRPELLFNENGENLEPIESRRILYYSFDKCEFPADSVMHKCRVHYLEPDKDILSPKQHPGFIVRKVYDSISNKLNELLDSGFEEWKQREISLLVQRTNQIIN
nr:bromo adjacent homology (BAH) domain-containing protein [Tanacetum cinerariifolium]